MKSSPILKKSNKLNNNIKKLLKTSSSLLYIPLVMNIIIIIYIITIITYLHKISSCPCFIEKNKNNYTNINYLLIIEYFMLFSNILVFISLLFVVITINRNIKKGGGVQNNSSFLHILQIFIIIIYSFFIYYVYKLNENISDDCECSKSWLVYLLYIQCVFMAITILANIYILINN